MQARKDRDEKVAEQEQLRVKRLEIASRMEQSWDLIRICKKTIKEKGKGWKESSESRNAQQKLEIIKSERLERAAAKKS